MLPHPAARLLTRTLALAAPLLLLLGCVTTDQVRDLVRTSNYELLVGADPALATTVPADASLGPKPAPAAAERLTAFLQSHPDDPVLGPTLHLRLALLYLNERQFDLADAAFAKIKGAKFTAARDDALAAAYPSLRWWTQWSLAGPGAFRAARADALAQMQALAAAAASDRLKASPDVADYFLEMRAWLGLKTAFAVVLPADADFQVQTLAAALDGWTATFDASQLALLNETKFDATQAFTLSTRRVLRLRTLLDALARTAKSGGALLPPPAVLLAAPAAQRYYETRLAAP